MKLKVDIWLRGNNHATTEQLALAFREPEAWTDEDVVLVLREMLRALSRAKDPTEDVDRPIKLRGFSWIVNSYDSGGVVIAIELTLGAVIAGPFDIGDNKLSAMIKRAIETDKIESQSVH
jgi:hypothetical protein